MSSCKTYNLDLSVNDIYIYIYTDENRMRDVMSNSAIPDDPPKPL
jgi:hypothetical protein